MSGFDPERDLELLVRTPSVLTTWMAGLDPHWADARPEGDAWTPREVLGHLVHGEETDWIPRARRLLEHGEALPFEPFDRTAHLRRFGEWDLASLLTRFGELRTQSVIALCGLPPTPANLERTGTHPELGRVTLDQLLCTWVVHDQAHLSQIARVLARVHAESVGPWRAYMNVLGR